MKRELRQKLLYKREFERTRKEKLARDIVCYWVTIFAAIMGFLLVDANINLANAESDFASNSVLTIQHL